MSSDAGGISVPPGAVTTPLPHALDSDNFTPRLIALLSNKLVWRESRLLRERFELGTNDWRVISALGLLPGASAAEISTFLSVNQAIVSKSVRTLGRRGLVTQAEVAGRARPLYLTGAGAAIHDEMLPISVAGQDIILEGLTAAEIEALNDLLRRLALRVEESVTDVG